jgi:hypothetical protein
MKKVLIVLALVVLAVVPVMAKEGFALGIELGQPSGVTFGYKVNDKWDGYVTAAVGFGKVSYLDAVAGAQFKVTDFEIGKAKFDVNVGGQAGINYTFDGTNTLAIAVRGTGSVSYDWTWKDVGDFTAYIRLAAGVRFKVLGDGSLDLFNWAGALGCVYHF